MEEDEHQKHKEVRHETRHAKTGLKNYNDTRHEKTDLKVLVVVIPKEGLVGWGPANPSLSMTPTIKYYSTAFIDYIL